LGITICIRDVELGPGLFNLQGSHSQITVIIQGFTDQPADLGIDKSFASPYPDSCLPQASDCF
jgi:hypothetical protein